MKHWNASVYTFFKPVPAIEYFDNCMAHVFKKTKYIHWFLYTGNTSSTSNLCHHAKACWNEEAVAATNQTESAATACKTITNQSGTNESITAAFEHVGKEKVTYSHCQYTKAESQYVVCINR